MTVKQNQSMLHRFTGKDGKRRLVDCLSTQALLAGDKSVANEIAKKGNLLEVASNKTVIEQNGSDNDLYFIITGSVSITVNGRQIAERNAGECVGEGSVVDPGARRSASVITKERSTFLKIDHEHFSRIAAKHPNLWRQMAAGLAARLRERNKFHAAPHEQPVVFIGSSSESLSAAEAIRKSLSKKPFIVRLWSDGVFQASSTTIEDLLKSTVEADFAIIVLSADDVGISRGKKARIPRDNAVFELGLFMGALGRSRSFIVTPDVNDLKIPTDLLGVTCLRYKSSTTLPAGRMLKSVNARLVKIISNLGPR